MAVFAYSRVSTHEQTTENQKLEIQRAGFNVDYWFEDVGVSGKTTASQRPQFSMLLTMLSAVAEMERSIIVERTQAGLARARAEGKKLGRRSKTTDEQKAEIRKRLSAGESVSSVARDYGVSRATVKNIRIF